MRSLRFLLFVAALSFTFAANAQNIGFLAGDILLNEIDLREDGDSLVYDMKVSVRAEAVNGRQSVRIMPFFYDSLHVEYYLPDILINGKHKARARYRGMKFEKPEYLATVPDYSVDLYNNYIDAVIDYSHRSKYDMWMDDATLNFKILLTSCAGKTQILTIEDGRMIQLLPRIPYAVDSRINLIVPEKENKRRTRQGSAYLDFPTGRSQILPDFRRNPQELAKINEAISDVRNNSDVEIVGLYVEGYASPEGSVALNQRLSTERANALKDYIRINYGLPETLFQVRPGGEDWDGLRSLVTDSNIAQKDRILQIIDSDVALDTKEARIKALGGPYRTMLNEMFPQLRRVEYQIDFTVKDYTLEEIREIVKRRPDQLSQYELFLLADSLDEDQDQQDEILEMIARSYPNDVTAELNAAAISLRRGEYTAATRLLEKWSDDPRSWNNLGVLYMLTDDLDKAEQYFRKALTEDPENARHNMVELEKKREDNEQMKRYATR